MLIIKAHKSRLRSSGGEHHYDRQRANRNNSGVKRMRVNIANTDQGGGNGVCIGSITLLSGKCKYGENLNDITDFHFVVAMKGCKR